MKSLMVIGSLLLGLSSVSSAFAQQAGGKGGGLNANTLQKIKSGNNLSPDAGKESPQANAKGAEE